jgi:hypothetical protein
MKKVIRYVVADNAFNRANYKGIIGKSYAKPPAYAAVNKVIVGSDSVGRKGTPKAKGHKARKWICKECGSSAGIVFK